MIAWKDGWMGYISISSGTTDDPDASRQNLCGQGQRGRDQHSAESERIARIARMIQATKSDISMSLTDGVSATSSEIQTNGSGKTSKSGESATATIVQAEVPAANAKTVSD